MKGILVKLSAALLFGASLVSVGAARGVAPRATNNSVAYRQTINERERRQQRRIRQGVRSGELNRRETRHLERRETHLRRDERRARRSGGELTTRERSRLQREENRTSRAIYRQKHDRQENGRRGRRRGRR
ncbi:MAG: hypothetical protein QOF61_186 [Acidobacteriota bacterium]|jgi:hypothetical protein|nr:hypothetical protein [Acidobacteriota bacterium]